jgi:hypothetical protein
MLKERSLPIQALFDKDKRYSLKILSKKNASYFWQEYIDPKQSQVILEIKEITDSPTAEEVENKRLYQKHIGAGEAELHV